MRRPDYKRRLVDYFKKNLGKGYTVDSLRWALINQGYSRHSIDFAMEEANKELAEKAPKIKEKPVIKYELYDENFKPIRFRRPWWKRVLGL